MSNEIDIKKCYIMDDFVDKRDIVSVYNRLCDTPNWKLNKTSVNTDSPDEMYSSFCGMYIYERGQILNPYWFGFFEKMTREAINRFEDEHKWQLPRKIWRMHLGAKNEWSKTNFHQDHMHPGAWTILTILTPFFKTDNGGEFVIQDQMVSHKPGRALIFPSNVLHNGVKTKGPVDYWKLALTTILTPEDEGTHHLDFSFRG